MLTTTYSRVDGRRPTSIRTKGTYNKDSQNIYNTFHTIVSKTIYNILHDSFLVGQDFSCYFYCYMILKE